MGKSYTIVFNSIQSSDAINNETYNYDWGQLPNKPYKITFSFVATIANLTNSLLAVLYMDLNQQCSMVAPSLTSSSTTGLKNNYLGTLLYSGTGANTYLFADTHTNPPLYINGRPTNNNVIIELHTNQLGGMTNYAPATFEYILTLNLEEC